MKNFDCWGECALGFGAQRLGTGPLAKGAPKLAAGTVNVRGWGAELALRWRMECLKPKWAAPLEIVQIHKGPAKQEKIALIAIRQ